MPAEPLLLAEFTPRRGATKVVATSANEDLTHFWPVVQVQPFDDDTDKSYLEARISRGNDKSAQAVAEAVGHNPLALAIASRHLRKRPGRASTGMPQRSRAAVSPAGCWAGRVGCRPAASPRASCGA